MPAKKYRVIFLLAVFGLAVVVLATGRPAPPPDWERPLKAVIYPYNADGSEDVARYIVGLRQADFEPIAQYMAEQAAPYRLPSVPPFVLALGEPIGHAPPVPPDSGGFLARVRWGLSLRWWYWRFHDRRKQPDIIVVARYHHPQDDARMLHSIGFSRLRLAVTRLIAEDGHAGRNHVVIAHEMLHTVGASDLYHPATGRPRYPEGYVQPDRRPRYPQPAAELMAGRVPLAPNRARQVNGLDETGIGEITAGEIGWANSGP